MSAERQDENHDRPKTPEEEFKDLLKAKIEQIIQDEQVIGPEETSRLIKSLIDFNLSAVLTLGFSDALKQTEMRLVEIERFMVRNSKEVTEEIIMEAQHLQKEIPRLKEQFEGYNRLIDSSQETLEREIKNIALGNTAIESKLNEISDRAGAEASAIYLRMVKEGWQI